MRIGTTKSRGDEAEELVADWVGSQGMHIVARNLRLGHFELDIVARDERVIVVIEVRRRDKGSWTSCLSSIDGKKRRRLRLAGGRLWDRRYKNDETVDRLRYDVAGVSFDEDIPRIEYIKAAF